MPTPRMHEVRSVVPGPSWIGAFLLIAACGGCATTTSKQEPTPGVVYVCHGDREPRWLRISASAADAHRDHGDRVSEAPQREKSPCSQDERRDG